MRLVSAAIVALLCSAGTAHAEQWRVTSLNTETGRQLIMFVDQDSVKRTGNTARASVMTVMELSTPIDQGGFTVSIVDREVDCSANRSRMVHSKYYHEGKLLEESTSASEWRAVNAGSMVEGVADAMCGRSGYITDKVTDPINFGFQLFKITPKI